MKTEYGNYEEQEPVSEYDSPEFYEVFKREVTRRLKVKVGRSRKNKVETGKVTKLNGEELDSIYISRQGTDLVPTFYLNDLYAAFRNGCTINDLVDMIYEGGMRDFPPGAEKILGLYDFDAIRDSICVKLINSEENAGLLNEVLHISFLDLAVVFYIRIPDGQGGSYHANIMNSMLETWKRDKSELIKLACKNMKRLNPVKACPLDQIIGEMYPQANEQMKEQNSLPVTNVIAISSETGNCGAVYMLDKKILAGYAEKFEDDILIIPSSIHEVIIMPAGAVLRDEADKTIKEVNRTVVNRMDYLSDHSYIYLRESNEITM